MARDVYRDPGFEPARAAAALLEGVRAHAAEAKAAEEVKLDGLDLPTREAEQRARRAAFGAEREELLATLEELARLVPRPGGRGRGARGAVVHVDRLAEIDEDGRASGSSAPSAPRSTCGRSGARSRSST